MGPKVEIAIGGRRAEGTLEKISLEQLRLDLTNVRFKHREKELPEVEVERYIWEEEDAKTLYKQIKTSGGLMEPPVVLRTSDEQLLVKEGNRRIVCLRGLQVLQGPFRHCAMYCSANRPFPEGCGLPHWHTPC
jgi:hypothetical protein